MIKIDSNYVFNVKKPPLIVAEVSGNHNGNKKKFLKLIDEACKHGADLIKIQTYEPVDITLNKKNNKFKIKKGIWKNLYLWDLYKKACTPFDWHEDAFKVAKKYNKILFSSPFSFRGVDLLERFNVPIYKIASFEITDVKLISYIASKKKPIIISTGMSTIKEIKTAIKTINKFHNKIIILHCVSSYPTKLKDSNLTNIINLKKKFKRYLIGLSDHTNDIISSIVSLQYNPVLIEKHFVLNEKDKTSDSKFSITPSQLSNLKNIINDLNIRRIKSKNVEKISKSLRRSIYSIKDIMKNEKLNEKNIDTFRPKIGICASKYFDVIGKTAKKKIKSGTPIKNNLLC